MTDRYKEGLKALNNAMKTQDDEGSFERCYVDLSCGKSPIKAHGIPVTALELISSPSKMVRATLVPPPSNIVAFQASDPLVERSIHTFSVGRWACHDHDELFAPIDSKSIDVESERNLFLVVCRVALRALQVALRTGGRMVFSLLEPNAQQEFSGLPRRFLEGSQRTAIEMTYSAMDLFGLGIQMRRILETESYHELSYRVALLESKPTMASAAIKWFDNLGKGRIWNHEYIGTSMIPGWMVILPQEHGHTIITASPIGQDRYLGDLHRNMPEAYEGITTKARNWRKRMSKKALGMTFDLAVSSGKYDSLTKDKQCQLQHYLRTRLSQPTNGWQLPNLLG